MKQLIKGDKVLWGLLALLAVFSFLPIFSASSNLAYVLGKGTPWGHLLKHFIILGLGFLFMFAIHKIPFHYFKGVSVLMLPIVLLLLVYTIAQGTSIAGANASRWVQIPIIGLSFQSSALASVVLMIYTAFYLAKNKDRSPSFKASLLPLWVPVFLVVLLILPANFSTAGLIFVGVCILCFVGHYPIRHLLAIMGCGIVVLAFFFLIAKSFPEAIPNRVDTWVHRIEAFFENEGQSEGYQIEQAKIAIASGSIFGMGAGKSMMKNFLPHSSSDFIYAIVVEEFGLVGGIVLIMVFMLLLFRIIVIIHKTQDVFGKLMVFGLGIPIILQAFVNIGVALNVFPVTGQTLPMISSGGTSAWMTCISFGIILSVTVANQKQQDVAATETFEADSENPIVILSETT